jgi:hypothetical protein
VSEIISGQYAQIGEDLTDLIDASTAVKAYAIEYETRDVDGRVITASGLVAVPDPAPGEYPVIAYLHGTQFNNQDVPSNPDNPHSQEAPLVMGLFAGHDYVAVMPDYIGQGSGSNVMPPYFEAQSMAASSADMLNAAQELCGTLGIRLDERLFICGLSQGGHATIALQRYLENDPTAVAPLRLTASAPFAGPYSIPMAWEFWVQNNPPGNAPLAVHLILAYKSIYGFSDTLASIFKPPYDTTVESVNDGTHNGEEMYGMLPTTLQELLQEPFLAQVADRTHPFYAAMEENNVYDFVPSTPTRFYHAISDELAPYWMSVFTYDHMIGLGATNVDLVALDLPWSHVETFFPATFYAKGWFDTFLPD